MAVACTVACTVVTVAVTVAVAIPFIVAVAVAIPFTVTWTITNTLSSRSIARDCRICSVCIAAAAAVATTRAPTAAATTCASRWCCQHTVPFLTVFCATIAGHDFTDRVPAFPNSPTNQQPAPLSSDYVPQQRPPDPTYLLPTHSADHLPTHTTDHLFPRWLIMFVRASPGNCNVATETQAFNRLLRPPAATACWPRHSHEVCGREGHYAHLLHVLSVKVVAMPDKLVDPMLPMQMLPMHHVDAIVVFIHVVGKVL